MNRREFIGAGVATAAATLPICENSDAKEDVMEYYELRKYSLWRGAMPRRMDDYLQRAFIPAAHRIGTGPVGVFTLSMGPDSPAYYVLLVHKSAESIISFNAKIVMDAQHNAVGADFLNAIATDPAFARIDSALMVAFSGMPALETPDTKKPRIFELRTYESHNEKANRKKIEMFNMGEIAIFRRTGLKPVFFGQTIVGSKMPNLTYLLTFDDNAARDKNWGQFVADPEWKKLSTTPGYADADILTNISNVFLKPTAYSEI